MTTETKSSQTLAKAAEAEEDDRKGKAGRTVNVYGDDYGAGDRDVKPQSFTYNPQPGDPEETVAFGKPVKKGEAVEFTDPTAIRKLKNNPSFWDDGKRKKYMEDSAKATLDVATMQRAVATEQDAISILHEEGQEVDMRVPEAPQLESIAQAKQRKLAQELKRIHDAPEPPPEGGATRKK